MKRGLAIAGEILLLIVVLVAAKILLQVFLSAAAANAASYALYVLAGAGAVVIYKLNDGKNKNAK